MQGIESKDAIVKSKDSIKLIQGYFYFYYFSKLEIALSGQAALGRV